MKKAPTKGSTCLIEACWETQGKSGELGARGADGGKGRKLKGDSLLKKG